MRWVCASQQIWPLDFRVGSEAEVLTPDFNFRFWRKRRHPSDVRSFPKMTHSGSRTPLFDHLVGERKKGRRDFEAERLGGLEVDHESVARGLLERQF